MTDDTQISSLSKRVERVESKIDDMFEVMISMARAEEKIANLTLYLSEMREENDELYKKIDLLESLVASNKAAVDSARKIMWIAISSFTAAGATLVMKIIGG
jgi:predicted RNase H-like nuclease (RuvC/YqgF family)